MFGCVWAELRQDWGKQLLRKSMGLTEAERCGQELGKRGGTRGKGRRMPLHRGVGRKRIMGRTRGRVWRGPAGGRKGGASAARRGGRWGVAGIVMQIILGEANVSPERILFLAMIPREPREERKEERKQGGKEKRGRCRAPGV